MACVTLSTPTQIPEAEHEPTVHKHLYRAPVVGARSDRDLPVGGRQCARGPRGGLRCAPRKDVVHRRRVRFGQVGDLHGRDGPVAGLRQGHRIGDAERRGAAGQKRPRNVFAARQGIVHDLPGPAHRSHPGLFHRRSAGGGHPGTPLAVPEEGRRRGRAPVGLGGHPRAEEAAAFLPARIFRRHAPARGHRHRHREQTAGHHRRRADHRLGRDHPGTNLGCAASGPARDWCGHHPHHPRHGRGRGNGRRRDGDVRRPPGGIRRCAYRLPPAPDAVHRGPARGDPAGGSAHG